MKLYFYSFRFGHSEFKLGCGSNTSIIKLNRNIARVISGLVSKFVV